MTFEITRVFIFKDICTRRPCYSIILKSKKHSIMFIILLFKFLILILFLIFIQSLKEELLIEDVIHIIIVFKETIF